MAARARSLFAKLALTLLLACAALAPTALAQTAPAQPAPAQPAPAQPAPTQTAPAEVADAATAADRAAAWDNRTAEAARLLGNPDTTAAQFDSIRSALSEQRSETQRALEEAQARVAEIRADIEALGPAPAEGETEAPEVAQQREQLAESLQAEQVALLAVQAANKATIDMLTAIDQRVLTEFSNRLITLGPSPLLPQRWPAALNDIVRYVNDLRAGAQATLTNSYARERLIRRLPVATLLGVVALVLLFGVRNRMVDWVGAMLGPSRVSRASAWLGALLNLSRLVVPTLGAVALIAALRTLDLFGQTGRVTVDALPAAAAALIMAYWIGHSLFAPILTRYRLVALDDDRARAGSGMAVLLGATVAVHLLLTRLTDELDADAATWAVLSFPLIVVAALMLLRLAIILRGAVQRHAPTEGTAAEAEPFGLNVLRILRRMAVFIALVAPVLAAVGYGALAEYLLFSSIRSVALIGGAYVVFAIFLNVLEGALGGGKTGDIKELDRFGLLPVFAAFVITLVSLPVLALIWGARPSGLWEIWVLLRDGISIGGSRISLTDFLLFVLVFGIGYTVTRSLQSVLRRSVMPRTRLDIGGQSAVVKGVGYVGLFIAALAAITSTGLDLSNLAIVAGALSVGVGFGLQTIVSNFVSGIILLVERPIKEGDWIEVAGFSGYVRRIAVRSTTIETFDRANVIVPNQELIAGSVLNYTHNSVVGRVIVPVGVSYGSDPREVERILREIAEDNPLVLRNPPPFIYFAGFGADSLDFEIRAILRDVGAMLSVRSEMNFEIARRFREAGIEIPFAQRDITLRNPEALADVLRILKGPAGDPPPLS